MKAKILWGIAMSLVGVATVTTVFGDEMILKSFKKNNSTISAEDKVEDKAEDKIEEKKIIEFDGNKVDLSELKKGESKKLDFNNDGIEDEMIVYKKEDDLGKEYIRAIVIEDGKTNEILTSFEAPNHIIYVEDIKDVTGDGVYDFLLYMHLGGNSSGHSRIMNFKDGGYVISEFVDTDEIIYTYEDGFKILAKSEDFRDEIIIENEKKRKELIEFKKFTSEGKALVSEELATISYDGMFEDINKDGNVEFVQTAGIGNFDLGNHEVSVIMNYKYEFKDGKFVVEDRWLSEPKKQKIIEN